METRDERDGDAIDPTRVVTVPRAAEGAADGDDIVVLPDGRSESGRPSRRRPLFLVGTALVAIALVAGVIAFSARDDGSTRPAAVRTITPGPTVPFVGEASPTTVLHKKRAVVAAPTVPSTRAGKSSAPVPRNQVVPPASIATPPPATTPMTAAAPKQYGTSVLTWSAPGRLTIPSGQTALLSVTAHNPTDGTVALPHPLACTPRLDQGETCAQVVEVIPPGGWASARYTIDAHGFSAGSYQLRIEGVLNIAVTVTGAPAK